MQSFKQVPLFKDILWMENFWKLTSPRLCPVFYFIKKKAANIFIYVDRKTSDQCNCRQKFFFLKVKNKWNFRIESFNFYHFLIFYFPRLFASVIKLPLLHWTQLFLVMLKLKVTKESDANPNRIFLLWWLREAYF